MQIKQIRNIGFFLFLCMMVLLPMQIFAESKSVTAQIPVSCTGSNTSESFIYNLLPETTDHQTIESQTLSLSDGGTGNFKITYTYPGTYHYKVDQNKGTDEKTTYDTTIYFVDVYVTENENGVLLAEVIAYIEGDPAKKQILSFVNKREITESDSDSTQDTEAEQISPVRTGDNTDMPLWGGMLILSVLLILMIMKRSLAADMKKD